MLDEVDLKFNEILQVFEQGNNSTDLITKAYTIARELHKDQRRKDGQMYIFHPLEVALILAKLDFDEKVISAAILHDVVEDCDYTLEQVTHEFGRAVAEMVDCVSAIDETKYIFDADEVFEDKNFEKESIESQSFKKLIAIGKQNPLGFCIKFADRLHNLRTIDCFPYSKQLEKVKETEKWIIPIAKTLQTEYFFRAISNECFKIKNKIEGKSFFEHRENYIQCNQHNVADLKNNLDRLFGNNPIFEFKIKPIREYKVFDELGAIFKNLNINKVSQGQMLKVANYDIFLLYKKKEDTEIVHTALNLIGKRLRDVRIIDAQIAKFTNKPFFQLEDKFKNKFNLYIMSHQAYIKQRNGTLDGQNYYMLDDDNINNLDVELIKVKTRSGENKFIQKGSTVLDFAFKIHRELGFGFKYAYVNDSKTKSPPFTRIYEGDKVEIVVDKDDLGEIVNNAELKWFAYVNTDYAKKVLIKFFERKSDSQTDLSRRI